MSTEPLAEPFEFESPKRGLRIVILCLPSWVAAFWALILVFSAKILPSLAHALQTKPATYTVTVWTMLAPLCWIGAVVSAIRAEETSRSHKVLLVLSAVAMVGTWLALWRFIGKH